MLFGSVCLCLLSACFRVGLSSFVSCGSSTLFWAELDSRTEWHTLGSIRLRISAHVVLAIWFRLFMLARRVPTCHRIPGLSEAMVPSCRLRGCFRMHFRDLRILDRQVGPVRMPLYLLLSRERWTARLRPGMAGLVGCCCFERTRHLGDVASCAADARSLAWYFPAGT